MRKPVKQACLLDRRSKDTAGLLLVNTANSHHMGKLQRQAVMDSQLQAAMGSSHTVDLQVVSRGTIAHRLDLLVREVMEARDMVAELLRLLVTRLIIHDT
jgi:hypothetical protein